MTTAEYTETELNEAMSVDPDAPYGRKLDGSPKKAPGGRPAGKRARAARTTGTRPSGATPPPPRASSAPRRKSSSGTDYRPGIVGLSAIVALPLRFLGPVGQLDAMTVQMHAPHFAEAVNETAKDRAEIAALCDKLLSVGPYGLIIESLLPMVAQVAENHGWLPTVMTTKLGAVPKSVLLAQAREFVAAQEAAEREAAEELAAAAAQAAEAAETVDGA